MLLLLRLDLREQALLAGATGVVALQLRADFALALAQFAQLGAQRHELRIQLVQRQRAMRLGLQALHGLPGGTAKSGGFGQGGVQAFVQLGQTLTLRLLQQCGAECRQIGERTLLQGPLPACLQIGQT
ncbi:hypothetical protein D9M71_361920 [compost metagenome]